jgi:hypothetical protein
MATGKASGFDGTVRLAGDADPTFVPRLTWRGFDKVPAAKLDLPLAISELAKEGARFFLDGSFFDDRSDPNVVAAVLAEADRAVLIPEVRIELAPYIGRRPNALISKALARNSPVMYLAITSLNLLSVPSDSLNKYFVSRLRQVV